MTFTDNKIMVLGTSGMLGSMVYRYLKSKNYSITSNKYRWPSDNFKQEVKNFSGVIVNCIGSIPQAGLDNYQINYELPVFLLGTTNKLVQPCTDCVYDGNLPPGYQYTGVNNFNANDEYGYSKRKFAEYTSDVKSNCKIIRCSIIGYDKKNVSLMSWLINKSEKDKVCEGYTNHFWNGVTTLTWAKTLEKALKDWNNTSEIIIPGIDPMNKYELLCTIVKTHKLNIDVAPVRKKHTSNKCLKPNIHCPNIEQQLLDMITFKELN